MLRQRLLSNDFVAESSAVFFYLFLRTGVLKHCRPRNSLLNLVMHSFLLALNGTCEYPYGLSIVGGELARTQPFYRPIPQGQDRFGYIMLFPDVGQHQLPTDLGMCTVGKSLFAFKIIEETSIFCTCSEMAFLGANKVPGKSVTFFLM